MHKDWWVMGKYALCDMMMMIIIIMMTVTVLSSLSFFLFAMVLPAA